MFDFDVIIIYIQKSSIRLDIVLNNI
jgi:hypothetical protein